SESIAATQAVSRIQEEVRKAWRRASACARGRPIPAPSAKSPFRGPRGSGRPPSRVRYYAIEAILGMQFLNANAIGRVQQKSRPSGAAELWIIPALDGSWWS